MPSYSLSILRHDQSSDLYTFEQAKVLIGREGGDIVTRDPKTSGRHGELTFEAGVLRFTDLNSTNGTYRVTGERVVGTIVLTPGTALRIGECTIAVQEIDSGVAVGPGGTQVMEQLPASAFADTALATAPAALAQLAGAAPAQAAPPPAAPAPAAPPQAAFGAGPAAAAPGAQAVGGPPLGQNPPGAPGGQYTPGGHGAPGGQQPLAAAPAAPYAAPPLAGSAGEGLFDLFKAFLSDAAATYKVHGIDGALTMGLVMLPGALIGIATGWIPVVGWIVGILVALVELAVTPIAAGAMWRWSMAAATGQRLTWKQAWGAAFKNPVSEWLNIAVMSFVIAIGMMFLVVPGLLLGMFAAPAYLLEKKPFVAANMRSLELVLRNPGRHLGLALLVMVAAVPVMILASVAALVLGFLPLVGGPLAQLVTVAVVTLLVPFVYLVWASIYFDARQRIEGEDAKALYAPTIRSWTGD